MLFPAAEPVTLHSTAVTGQDVYGNDVRTSTDVAAVAAFTPGGATEFTVNGDQITTRPMLFLDPSSVDAEAVKATDAVTARGVRYQVDGTPQDWRSPFTGWTAGIVVNLKAVTG